MTPKERAHYIQTLRQRFLKGTLDKVLIPDDPPIARLLDAIFSTELPSTEPDSVNNNIAPAAESVSSG